MNNTTLRDQFAMAAMQGEWSNQSNENGYFSLDTSDETLKKAAVLYYRMADAMLAARNEKAVSEGAGE